MNTWKLSMLTRFCFFIFYLVSLFFLSPANSQELISYAKKIIKNVEKIRQLKAIETIKWKIADRTEVRSYLKQALKEQYVEGEIEREGYAYQALGFVPLNIDYKHFLLSLYEVLSYSSVLHIWN